MMAEAPLPRIGGGVDLSAMAARAKAAQQPASANAVLEVTNENLQSVVEQESATYPIVLAVVDKETPDASTLIDRLTSSDAAQHRTVRIATLDARAYPDVVQALQVPQLPITIAVIGGRLLPLFAGIPEASAIDQAFAQVVQAAQQAGVTNTAPEPATPETPTQTYTPTQQRAYAAMEAGDYATAAEAFAAAVEENAHDDASARGLVQAQLFERIEHPDTDPTLREADAAVRAGTDIESAFSALLQRIGSTFGDDRVPYQSRLVDYFVLLGPDDPRVVAARRDLAQLLY